MPVKLVPAGLKQGAGIQTPSPDLIGGTIRILDSTIQSHTITSDVLNAVVS